MSQSMQKLGLAGCMMIGLALSTQPALAQSTTNVTIYGIVDAGIEYTHGVAAAGRKENLTRLNGSNQLASRWGLRGTEDLGGGVKAVFNLENGFSPDTGNILQSGRLFGRASVVGVESPWGTVLAGRQRNTIFDLILVYDPLPLATYGVTAHDNAFFTQRPDNSIKYSYKAGPLSGSLLYSFGRDALTGTPAGSQSEVPGNSRIGRQMGASLNYAAGPVSVAFGYDQQQGVTAATASEADRRYLLAGIYDIASTRTKLYAGVVRRENDVPAIDTTSHIYWVGFKQGITGQLGLAAQLSRATQSGSPNKATLLGTSLYYDLSKRTQLYLNMAYVKNDGASAQGVANSTPAVPGENQTGVVSGIMHRF